MHNFPSSDRHSDLMPREKLLQYGAERLSDAELLAIFLRTGIKGCSVMQLAEQTLDYFGSLRNLLSADLNAFCHIRGLGQTQFIQLQATKELSKRYFAQQMHAQDVVREPELAIRYCQAELEACEREVFLVLFLTNQHTVIKSEKMFLGTINQATVHPREIVKEGLKCNAAAIIVAHNHPSGNCTPSEADHQLTRRIKQACELVDIRFVDHIVVGKGHYFSFACERLCG